MAEHGTRTMYVHYGCRCEACCRAEHEQYLKRKEAQQRKRTFSKWNSDIATNTISEPRRIISQRRYNHRRYAITHAHKITWQEIAKRDGTKCALCGRETNPHDVWYSENGRKCYGRTYPTVDHIIPLKQGGEHDLSNVQLACKRCNSSKGSNKEWVCTERKAE